jgi:hypothetical protein
VEPTRKPELKQKLLQLVPIDGQPIGNGALRQLFRNQLATTGDQFTDEDYWLLRDSLIDDGIVQTGRGRGGSVRRVVIEKEQPPLQSAAPAVSAAEADLYEPFHTAIKTGYAPANAIRRFVSEVTARQGRRVTGGKWTRPDITMIGIRTYAFTPGKRLEVITFEVKPNLDTALEGVFEALAHSVFAHRSYLAVHVPNYENIDDLDDERIAQECERFGVGYMLFSDPGNFDTYDIVSSARLKEPDPAEIDDFIKTQISPQNQEELREWIR